MGFEWTYMIDIRPTWVNANQSKHWEEMVRLNLTTMAGTGAGQALMSAIAFYKKWVQISPYDFTQGDCNAYAWYPPADKPARARDGNAFGAMVYYSPHMFAEGGACFTSDPGLINGQSPDQILFHELVHAFRISAGTLNMVSTSGGLRKYDYNEEFYAILITNIYTTDPKYRTRTGGLRKDHDGGHPLENELADSFSFFESSTNTFDLVSTLCTAHPGLAGALAKVPAAFNPIAAFFQDRDKARLRSLSARAMVRDAAGWGAAITDWMESFLPV